MKYRLLGSIALTAWLTGCQVLVPLTIGTVWGFAHAHRMSHLCKLVHLADLDIVQGSYDGNTFKTKDGKCWYLYKAYCVSISSPQLHVKEIIN